MMSPRIEFNYLISAIDAVKDKTIDNDVFVGVAAKSKNAASGPGA